MVNESEVRARIAEVLDGAISLPDFREWLLDASWNIQRDNAAFQLVKSVQSVVSEHVYGYRNDAELRSEIARLVTVPVIFADIVFDGIQIPPSAKYSSQAKVVAKTRAFDLASMFNLLREPAKSDAVVTLRAA